jgi:glycosyltransferase involved in cell wall biosynthesis
MFKVPLIVHTRNILGKRAFQRMFLFGPDVLIANSNAVLQSYLKYTRGGQRKVIVHNGVDLEEFSPDKGDRSGTRARLGFKDHDFVIGLFGRIAPEKGHGQFLRVLAEVARHHSNVRAVIAGDTSVGQTDRFLEELQELAARLGLANKVVFPGFVNSMTDLYLAIDLLVCPSDAEPFGRVLIEAMAMQIPVIANRSGGALEIVEHGRNGFLVNTFDKGSFARAIVSLLNNPSLCSEMGRKGRAVVENRFSAQKMCRETEAVYAALLRGRKCLKVT